MDAFLRMPAGIVNAPRWEEQCRKIHARASEHVAGKLTAIQAALALNSLAIQTRAAQDDPDFSVFRRIYGEVMGLPVGGERQHWAQLALAREDVKIRAIEERWKSEALAAALRLVAKYRWALAARQRRRKAGHVV